MANLIPNKEDISPASINKYQFIAVEANQLFTEIYNLITGAGLTPSSADLTQIKKAINSMIETKITGKQDTLSAGDGIDITNNTVSLSEPLPTKLSQLSNDIGAITYEEEN